MTGDVLTVLRVYGSDYLKYVYGGVSYGHSSTGATSGAYNLSRLLTGTVNEQDAGVFTGSQGYGLLDYVWRLVNRKHRPPTVVWFNAGGQSRTFRFTTITADDDLAYIRDEILDRISVVRAWATEIGTDGEALTFEVPS